VAVAVGPGCCRLLEGAGGGKGHRVLDNVEELVDDRRALEAPTHEEEHGHHAPHLVVVVVVVVVVVEGLLPTACITHLPTYPPTHPPTYYLPPNPYRCY
jgi:hypothetical protein